MGFKNKLGALLEYKKGDECVSQRKSDSKGNVG